MLGTSVAQLACVHAAAKLSPPNVSDQEVKPVPGASTSGLRKRTADPRLSEWESTRPGRDPPRSLLWIVPTGRTFRQSRVVYGFCCRWLLRRSRPPSGNEIVAGFFLPIFPLKKMTGPLTRPLKVFPLGLLTTVAVVGARHEVFIAGTLIRALKKRLIRVLKKRLKCSKIRNREHLILLINSVDYIGKIDV